MASATDIFLDGVGTDSRGDVVVFDNIEDRVVQLAYMYKQNLTDKLVEKDISSSGALGDSIQPQTLTVNGSVYTVEIAAKEYASYIDEGVDGWANNRGSRFKFKTKGTRIGSPMYNSLEAYIKREGARIRNVKVAVSQRERKGMKMTATQRSILAAAAGIKRYGIAPTHFWKEATKETEKQALDLFTEALRIDIINNIR